MDLQHPIMAVYTPHPSTEGLGPEVGTRETLRVDYCVTTQGKTVNILAGRGIEELRDAAERAVAIWRFKPAIVGGAAVDVCTAVVFVLDRVADEVTAPPPLIADVHWITELEELRLEGEEGVVPVALEELPIGTIELPSVDHGSPSEFTQLRFCLDPEGHPHDVEVVQGGHLAEQLREALRLRSYAPGLVDGAAVERCELEAYFWVRSAPAEFASEPQARWTLAP